MEGKNWVVKGTNEENLPASRHSIGDRVVFDTRHWWYWLWMKPYYRFGEVENKTYCCGWIYKVKGCDKWCGEEYLIEQYNDWYKTLSKPLEVKRARVK